MSSAPGLVIDASAAADLLRPTQAGDAVARAVHGQALHAPDLIDLEVASAIARWERAGETTARNAVSSLQAYQRLPIARRAGLSLIKGAWDLRQALRLSDAYYVALARTLNLPLLTTDLRLARAVHDQGLCALTMLG